MYLNGEGVLQDEVMAYALSSVASIEGNESIIKMRDTLLYDYLSPQQIQQGKKIARDLLNKIEENKTSITKNKTNNKSEDTHSPTNKNELKVNENAVSGSAFIVTKDGYVVTCYHVIEGASKILISSDNKEYSAELIRANVNNDLALLKINGRFPSLSLSSNDSVKMGNDVFTIGYPNPILQGVNQKLTEGSINSLTGYQDDMRLYQISVPIQPGNSGGALFDENGEVIGIVVALLKAEVAFEITGSLPQNVNYALKSSYIRELVESVPDAARGIQGADKFGFFNNIIKHVNKSVATERVRKSVVMVTAYK